MRWFAAIALACACSSTGSRSEPAADSPEPPDQRPSGDGGTVQQPWIVPAAAAVRPEAVGLWRVPTGDRHRRISPTVVGSPGTVRFLYDGQTVVMMLFTTKEWMWRSPDDHYRLSAEWRGDTLYYRPPFADFVELARFTGGRFESTGDTPPYRYENVPSQAACDPDDLPLLAERPLHDYTIKPMDRR